MAVALADSVHQRRATRRRPTLIVWVLALGTLLGGGMSPAPVSARQDPLLPQVADPVPSVTVGVASSSATRVWSLTSDGLVRSIEIGQPTFTRTEIADLGVFAPSAAFIDADPLGEGLVALGADGGVFAVLGAPFLGSVPALGVRPSHAIIAVAVTTDSRGYWLVGADGGVFAFGDAPYLGSLPALGVVPAAPIVDIVASPGGSGYWLVGADGGVFAFGDAPFLGSNGANTIASQEPIVGMAAQPAGYWLLEALGTTTLHGAVPDFGSYSPPAHSQITIVDVDSDGSGYVVGLADGRAIRFGAAG
jgi:hypothetical protein